MSAALRALWVCLPLTMGCGQSLDAFLFNGQALESYVVSEHIPAEHLEALSFSSGGKTLAGFFIHNPEGARRQTTILYCHGNYHSIQEYWDRMDLLWDMGYQVLIWDYRGYGMSEGPPTEEGLYEDVRAVFDLLQARPDVDPDRIVAYGFSLGGVPAVDLAWRDVGLQGLITEAAFASAAKLVQDSSRLAMGKGWLVDGTWDSETKLRSVTLPKLLMHGVIDDFINPTHLDVLAAAAAEPKEIWYVEGAGHGDLPEIAGQDYVDRVGAFTDGLDPAGQRPY